MPQGGRRGKNVSRFKEFVLAIGKGVGESEGDLVLRWMLQSPQTAESVKLMHQQEVGAPKVRGYLTILSF